MSAARRTSLTHTRSPRRPMALTKAFPRTPRRCVLRPPAPDARRGSSGTEARATQSPPPPPGGAPPETRRRDGVAGSADEKYAAGVRQTPTRSGGKRVGLGTAESGHRTSQFRRRGGGGGDWGGREGGAQGCA